MDSWDACFKGFKSGHGKNLTPRKRFRCLKGCKSCGTGWVPKFKILLHISSVEIKKNINLLNFFGKSPNLSMSEQSDFEDLQVVFLEKQIEEQ